jgi:hypothetical protein
LANWETSSFPRRTLLHGITLEPRYTACLTTADSYMLRFWWCLQIQLRISYIVKVSAKYYGYIRGLYFTKTCCRMRVQGVKSIARCE